MKKHESIVRLTCMRALRNIRIVRILKASSDGKYFCGHYKSITRGGIRQDLYPSKIADGLAPKRARIAPARPSAEQAWGTGAAVLQGVIVKSKGDNGEP